MPGTDEGPGGRSTNIGSDDADGRDGSIGGSTSGGDPGDERAIGDGQVTRTGSPPLADGDPEQASGPTSGTPDDLKPGVRRTVGIDEDDGAGREDMSGTSGEKLENG